MLLSDKKTIITSNWADITQNVHVIGITKSEMSDRILRQYNPHPLDCKTAG